MSNIILSKIKLKIERAMTSQIAIFLLQFLNKKEETLLTRNFEVVKLSTYTLYTEEGDHVACASCLQD